MQVCYLILHYKNIHDTTNCIKSILELDGEDTKIVIVDNGSEDGTYEELKEKYKDTEGVDVITTGENLGFSKGNNFGYNFIKENYNPDFIVVSNNDILFPQKDFNKRIIDCFEKEQFYLLGPDIHVRVTGEHQSPLRLTCIKSDDVRRDLAFYKKYSNVPKKYAFVRKLQITKNKLYFRFKGFRRMYDKLKHKTVIDRTQIYYNCCLQGACIILSKNYISQETEIFEPRTFLYCEEQFLHLRCVKKGYKIVYNPDLLVWHEDSSSIKSITKNAHQKAVFTLKHHVLACESLLDYVVDYEENFDDKV